MILLFYIIIPIVSGVISTLGSIVWFALALVAGEKLKTVPENEKKSKDKNKKN